MFLRNKLINLIYPSLCFYCHGKLKDSSIFCKDCFNEMIEDLKEFSFIDHKAELFNCSNVGIKLIQLSKDPFRGYFIKTVSSLIALKLTERKELLPQFILVPSGYKSSYLKALLKELSHFLEIPIVKQKKLPCVLNKKVLSLTFLKESPGISLDFSLYSKNQLY